MKIILVASLILSMSAFATPKKIIALSPHLTELTFALGAGDKLVAVSDFSDYPAAAKTLPSVASHQGVNFESIMRLQPDLILAWQGGNKPQDLQRLESLGYALFYSNPKHPIDIANEIQELGALLGQQATAIDLANDYRQKLNSIARRYKTDSPQSAFYYMWSKPLMTIGGGAWANHLLELCGAKNIFFNAIADYPEVAVESVIERKPDVIIAALKSERSELQAFWQPWQKLLGQPITAVKQVNPDLLHRYSPRLLDGVEQLCQQIN